MPAHPLSSDDGLKEAARSTLRELLTISKRYRMRRQRLDTLFLFEARARKKAGKTYETPKATVAYDDAPEMELMLKHRDAYEQLAITIDAAHEGIRNTPTNPDDPYALMKLMDSVNRLEAKRDAHLESIREILQQVSRELIAQENVLAKVVAEGAKLSQLALINREKIAHEAEQRGGGTNSKSNSELLQIAQEIGQRNGHVYETQPATD